MAVGWGIVEIPLWHNFWEGRYALMLDDGATFSLLIPCTSTLSMQWNQLLISNNTPLKICIFITIWTGKILHYPTELSLDIVWQIKNAIFSRRKINQISTCTEIQEIQQREDMYRVQRNKMKETLRIILMDCSQY